MDIVRFSGGMGNQMFQYALVEALRNRGRKVRCSLEGYRKQVPAKNRRNFLLDRIFGNVDLQEIDDSTFDTINAKWKEIKSSEEKRILFKKDIKKCFFYVEEESLVYNPEIFETENCTFVGYWQAENYFRNIRKTILGKYTFTNIDTELDARLNNQKTYCSVHIRRGDYLNNPALYMDICTEEYYREAIKYIHERFPQCIFFFFSDDMTWVKEKFRVDNGIYQRAEDYSHYEDWYDMYLMSKCTHNIVANSSFSWWGAWLNTNQDKIVIAPKTWANGFPAKDIYPPEWIRI